MRPLHLVVMLRLQGQHVSSSDYFVLIQRVHLIVVPQLMACQGSGQAQPALTQLMHLVLMLEPGRKVPFLPGPRGLVLWHMPSKNPEDRTSWKPHLLGHFSPAVAAAAAGEG